MSFFPLQLSSQYEHWAEQLQNAEVPRDLKETEVQLRNLGEHINHIQTTTFEVAQRGQDLLQVISPIFFKCLQVITHCTNEILYEHRA